MFAEGRSAFERQDFAGALASFEAAVAAGMGGPAVQHNIGVAAYRLQRYDKAKAAFEEVARAPSMAALAHYNLGLIARAESDQSTAHGYFSRVLSETEDERLRSLAQAQLDASPKPAPSMVWAVFAAAGSGYDDNVALTSGGTTVGLARQEDVYSDILLAGSIQLPSRWRFEGDAAFLNYLELDEFDQRALGVGGRYRFDVEEWRPEIGARAGVTSLDGDRLEDRYSVFVQSTHDLSSGWSVRGRYRFNVINGADQYEDLDGSRHEMSARFFYSADDWGGSLSYLFESSDYRTNTLSATRHQLLADGHRELTSLWTVRGSAGFRYGDYEDPSIGAEYRFELSAAVERLLGSQWTLAFRYFFTESDVDADVYDYRRNRLLVGIEATF